MDETTTIQSELSLEEIKRRYHGYLGKLVSYALERKAKRGECIGLAPTGYRNVRAGDTTRIEIDPVLGLLVEEAFRLAARKRSSLRQVLAELTPKGLVSQHGTPLGISALAGILTNPFYVGMIRYKGHFYQGDHEALVSPSLYDRAGRSLRRRRRRFRTQRISRSNSAAPVVLPLSSSTPRH